MKIHGASFANPRVFASSEIAAARLRATRLTLQEDLSE